MGDSGIFRNGVSNPKWGVVFVFRVSICSIASIAKHLDEALLIHLNQTKWKKASIFTSKYFQDAFLFSKSCWQLLKLHPTNSRFRFVFYLQFGSSGLHKFCMVMTVHASGIMHTQKFVLGIDFSMEKYFEFGNLSHRPLCFKKIKTATTTEFLIFSTVVLDTYSHITGFNPQSFAPLS